MKRMLTAAVALLLLAPAPAHAAAADTAPPTLHAIQLSHTQMTVQGVQVGRLTVTARLRDESGVHEFEGDGVWDFSTPVVYVGYASVRLMLISGTPKDGVWSGIAPVTSDWASGLYRPTLLSAGDYHGNALSVDPRTVVLTPSVRVTSTRRPIMSLTITPNPATSGVDDLVRTVRVIDPLTKRPWRGVPVAFASDNACYERIHPGRRGVTDTSGRISSTHPARYHWDVGHCAWIDGEDMPGQPPTRILHIGADANYRWRVTARPAATSARAGTNVAVTGTLMPVGGEPPVQLQRRYSDGVWRTVNRGTATTDYLTTDFRLVATPPGVGTYSYRVFAPAGDRRMANASAVFTIRGT